MKWIRANGLALLGMMGMLLAFVWTAAVQAQSIRSDVAANKSEIEAVKQDAGQCLDQLGPIMVRLEGLAVRLDETLKRLEREGR